MPFLSYTNDFDNFMQVLLRDHKRYLPIVEFLDNVTQQLTELSWKDCEHIAAELSVINASEFCTGIHKGVGNALSSDDSADKRDLGPILTLAKKLNADAGSVTGHDVQTVMSAGWSEQTIEDLVGLVAVIKLYNTLANGLGFKAVPDEVFAAMGQSTVQQHGYTATFQAYTQSS